MNFQDELVLMRFNFTLVYSVVSLLCIFVLLLIAFKEKFSSIYTIARVYSIRLASCAIFLVTVDTLYQWLESGFLPQSLLAFKIVDTLFFCFDAIIYLYMFLYFEYSLGYIHTKKTKFFYSIPFIFTIALEIINMKYSFLYHFEWDAAHKVYKYVRDKYFILGRLIPFGYLLGQPSVRMIIYLIQKRKGKEVELKSLPSIMCLAYTIALAAYFNTAISALPLYTVILSFGFFLFYQNEIENLMSQDPLTRISNRRELNFAIKRQIASFKHLENANLYLVSIDANDFKQINDKYGHDIGDSTLRAIADGMKRTLGNYRENKSSLYRFGGDEFSILLQAKDDGTVKNIMEEVNKNVIFFTSRNDADYTVSISYGIARYQEGMTKLDFLKKADTALYENKRSYHKSPN